MSAQGPNRAVPKPSTEWATPWEFFELLDREFRFDLDAAASPENRKCSRYLTIEENALVADIFDRTVFCNPPYGRGLIDWVDAFQVWAVNGCTVVALLPANTDTEWFREAFWHAHEVRLLSGRINFEGSLSGNTGGSAVFVYRPGHLPYGGPNVGVWKWR